jgi:hypothetical protein
MNLQRVTTLPSPLTGVPKATKVRSILTQSDRTLEAIVEMSENPYTRHLDGRRRSDGRSLPNSRRGSRSCTGRASLHAQIRMVQEHPVAKTIKAVAVG